MSEMSDNRVYRCAGRSCGGDVCAIEGGTGAAFCLKCGLIQPYQISKAFIPAMSRPPEPQPELPGIESTLAERGKRYGVFAEHAAIVQDFKSIALAVRGGEAYRAMKPDARQAVDVIFDKVARMLNGDPEYDDNWRDIAGYATLVLKRIEAES